ncbi:MAG: hypothetical protein NVS9B1_22690 [Candidatus Dormibacteraceae bacterium]
MSVLRWLQVAMGAVVVWVVLRDLFISVVVPRPARGRLRPSSLWIRFTWIGWRWFGGLGMNAERRENTLGAYAPLALITLLIVWVMGLIFGYGLILNGLRDQLRPVPADLGTTIYFSAVSLLTIGFGDIVPSGAAARILVMFEAGTGLGVVAVVISLLFSLYASFQRRETLIITLDPLAGAPPSGVTLLENSLRFDMLDHLGETFDEWKLWSAEVLESHLAYPILNYFRSSHDNESWIGALGAMLDAAVLVLTTVEDAHRGPARLMYEVGSHLVEDLGSFFGFAHNHEVGVERFEFEQACDRLAAAGYTLADPDLAWKKFSELRSKYAVPLNEMARWWAIPPAQWIGDRSYLPHQEQLAAANRH